VAPNAPVTFTGPSNGAGGMLANGSATYMTTTNSSGVATSARSPPTQSGQLFGDRDCDGRNHSGQLLLDEPEAPALSITESHAAASPGQSGATYAITVGNAVGAGPARER